MYEHELIERAWLKHPKHRSLVAVETGTCLGYSTRRLSRIYSKVHTVELGPDLSKRTKGDMIREGYDNIVFHVGDSAEVLPDLIRRIREPCLFFLDAHWSGDRTVDWQRSEWKGYGVETSHVGEDLRPRSEDQVPLLLEVQTIAKDFPYEAIIYMDDYYLFGLDGRGCKDVGFIGNDWSHLHVDDLKKACGSRLLDWIATNEQLVVVLSPLR